MQIQRMRFSKLLPILALLVSLLWVTIPAIRTYVRLRCALRGSEAITLSWGEFAVVLTRDRLPRFALDTGGSMAAKPVIVLNAPARLVSLLPAHLIAHRPFWTPWGLMPSAWVAISFPIFAMPAWYFVGRGADGFLLRLRIKKTESILSVMLCGLFLAMTALMVFAFSPEERNHEWSAYVAGFALWTVLFALPFVARRKQARSHFPELDGAPIE